MPKFSECTQRECTNFGAFFGQLFLCPNFQSAPKVKVLMLAHFLGGYFYAQIFRVIQQCQSAPNMNAPKMRECAKCESAQNVRVPYQIWKSGHQIWKGGITHGQHEMVHCNVLISNTTQQKYQCIGLILEKYTITWNSFVSG